MTLRENTRSPWLRTLGLWAVVACAGCTLLPGLTPVDADAGTRPSEAGLDPFPSPEPSGCVQDVGAGSRRVACGHLSFDLHVPKRCLHAACGLVLDVHGGSMTGAWEEKNTQIAARGAERGYIVVQPNAIPRQDLGPLPKWGPERDDALVRAFAGDVQAAFHTDPDRTHMTGFSLGGFMTWRFVCEHADWLASVAVGGAGRAVEEDADATRGCAFDASERPSRELPILFLHGTRDRRSVFAAALELRERLRALFEMDAGRVVAGDELYTHTRYVNPRGVVLEFIQHDYAVLLDLWGGLDLQLEGHCYPGSEDWWITLPGQFAPLGCAPPNAFHWGESVLDFFDAHPRALVVPAGPTEAVPVGS